MTLEEKQEKAQLLKTKRQCREDIIDEFSMFDDWISRCDSIKTSKR